MVSRYLYIRRCSTIDLFLLVAFTPTWRSIYLRCVMIVLGCFILVKLALIELDVEAALIKSVCSSPLVAVVGSNKRLNSISGEYVTS